MHLFDQATRHMMVPSHLPLPVPWASHSWHDGDTERLSGEALLGFASVKCASGHGVMTRSPMHSEVRSTTAVSDANLLSRLAVEAAMVVKPDPFLVAPSKIIISGHNTSCRARQIDTSKHSNLVPDRSDRWCPSSFYPVRQSRAFTA